MIKLQLDVVYGVYEVAEFSEDAVYCGRYTAYDSTCRACLSESFDGTRSMEVSKAVYDSINTEYGIRALRGDLVRASVKDRMTGELVYKTRKASYYVAHMRAEKWCKRNLGERGTIVELD